MIKAIKPPVLADYKEKLHVDDYRGFIWSIDRFFKSDFSTIRPSISGNVYRELLKNGCDDERYVNVQVTTRTITRPYKLEMHKGDER